METIKLNSLINPPTPVKQEKKKVKKKKVNKPNVSNGKGYIPDVGFSIQETISKNYEGVSDNVLGIINTFPIVIRKFFENIQLLSIKVSSSLTECTFENKFYLRITRSRLAGKPNLFVTIKQGKKVYYNNYVKNY